jgi:hypothetical protein
MQLDTLKNLFGRKYNNMKQLQSISVVAPGFSGLNTQDSSVTLPNSFSLSADNCVIDKYGRLGSRKGWTMQTEDGDDELDDENIEFIYEHVNADDTVVTLSGGNLKLFTNGDDEDALVDITPESYTVTGNSWKAASLNDVALIVQAGHIPLVYTEGDTPVCQELTDFKSHSPSYGSSYPQDVTAAYGRFWVHDGQTVYWSTDIADSNFPAFAGGTSGTLNIASVLPNNVDRIVTLAAHNDFLIIFCEYNTVIYQGAASPISDTFGLQDVIAGVGCIARDSVQHTGNDLLFLSHEGVRSLGRVVQEKSLPQRDLTKNVRDELSTFVESEVDLNKIKSVYSEREAFYLLTFPTLQTVYCLDMRKALEDGSARVTKWANHRISALAKKRNQDILIGKTNGIGKYEGYQDNGVAYRMRYESTHIDFQDSAMTKILKQINATVIGGGGQVFTIRSGTDYRGPEFQYELTLDDSGIYEWGADEWGLMSWTNGVAVEQVFTPANGAGKTLQIFFEAVINGSALSVQRLDLFVKTGRIN